MKTAHTHFSHEAKTASPHGSMKSYVVGFILSLGLTIASFAAVMTGVLPRSAMLGTIVVLCVVQLVVQLVYFLHMGTAPDQRENTAIFVCTGLLIVIVVAGSLWVMHNANVNMMPTQMSTERAISRD
jgi:cytochrome o ubiquinol oxidase operon protein cyoD